MGMGKDLNDLTHRIGTVEKFIGYTFRDNTGKRTIESGTISLKERKRKYIEHGTVSPPLNRKQRATLLPG